MAKPESSIRWALPVELQTALEALYGHYDKTFRLWEDAEIAVPPCFIVVCNNTSTSKLVYDFIAGFEHAPDENGVTPPPHLGRFELFRNYDEHGNRLPRPRTLLIDSEQLESGEALEDNFRDMATDEIERFRREILAAISAAGRSPNSPTYGRSNDTSARRLSGSFRRSWFDDHSAHHLM